LKILKKLFVTLAVFILGWIWGFLSLRALLDRARSSVRPSSVVKKAANGYDSFSERVSNAISHGRHRARMREAELRRRFGLEY